MDRESAARVLESMYPSLRRFAGAVGPPDVAPDDLVQEAFLRALQRGLEGIDDLPAYLRQVVVNISSTARRSFVRRQAAFARHGVGDETEELESPLLSEVMRLPAELRAVLWLAEVEGRPYAEIARLLGCTEEAARTRASRARRRLRLELSQEER